VGRGGPDRGPGHGGLATTAPRAASGDGRVIVGVCSGSGGGHACVWIDGQAFPLADLLGRHHGLDIRRWTFDDVQGCSYDGRTLVGYGTHDGTIALYKAVIDPAAIRPSAVREGRDLGPSAALYAYYGYLYGYYGYATHPDNASLGYGYLYDHAAGQVTYVAPGEYASRLATYKGHRYSQALSSYYAYLYAYYGSTVNYDGTVYYAMLLNYYAFYYGYYDSV